MLKPLTDEEIKGMAEFGATISRWCRNSWTGEQIRVSVGCDKVGHPWHKAGRQVLDYLHLIAWENVADLNQFRLGVPGQHAWKKADWERAIRFKMENGPDARLAQ